VLILFSTLKEVVHKEFIPEGQRVNTEFYKGIMDHLLKHIQRGHPAVFCSRDFSLLHNNVPAHKPASVCQFLTPKKLQLFITHCPNLSLPDYFLFPKVKMKLRGLHFTDGAEIQEA
jgi:hypothetical protein